MAVATGLTFQLYDALKMLGDSPEHQQFKSEVLCFLSGQKEAERPNTEDLEANSDDDTHGQGAKGTYKDTMALNPELPKLPEDLRDSADSPKTERASQLLQDQREIRAKRKAQLQAKEAEPKKRGRPPKTEKGKEESKEESKEDKKEEEQDELSMENALDKDDQELRVERALEDDDNDAKPRRRSTTKGSGRGGKKRKGPDGKTKGKEPGPENEQEATEGKTEEKPGSAKEAEETTKKPDKEPRENDDNKGKGNGKKKREKGPKARLESHHRSESNVLIQLRCPTNLRLGQLTGQFSRISFITCTIKANYQLTTLQDPDETPPPNKRGREDW